MKTKPKTQEDSSLWDVKLEVVSWTSGTPPHRGKHHNLGFAPPFPGSNQNSNYVWGYPGAHPMMAAPPGADGNYCWPIYVQGGTASNPQFAYYPIPPGTVPGVAGTPSKHKRRPVEDQDDEDDNCKCPDCTRQQPAAAGHGGSVPPGQPTAFMPTQIFTAAPPAQQTTFIPYIIPSSPPCNRHCKTKSSSGSNSSNDKKHSKKSPTSSSSYHYASACQCTSCKARRMAIEMDRLKDEKRREKDYKDAKDFFKMKERVDREDREADMEEEYRASKRVAEGRHEDAYVPYYPPYGTDEGYEWAVPITAFQTGRSTPIILEPIHYNAYHDTSDWQHLEAENSRLRRQKDHLKHKVQHLNQDVHELKSEARSTHGTSRSQTPVVEAREGFSAKNRRHQNRSDQQASTKAPMCASTLSALVLILARSVTSNATRRDAELVALAEAAVEGVIIGYHGVILGYLMLVK
ncbi:hypothetical protein H072_9262 [Dactylellina haptotyla CBS 200.50]|uniref:Uncharacterized protein n=1 Tax=Dactylellina haptotyla (strain CBS 200.50) TaxID=1284197 RepID=S8BD21_DACHA|nr:hypothetical protein H072_9262 [Dactylellina haptotyla CBS 200.50]